MSTPLQMARAECANYERDGSCLGIGIRHPKCLLAEPGKRCVYFEECVLPMECQIGEQIGSGGDSRIERKPLPQSRIKEWQDGQREYKEMAINK